MASRTRLPITPSILHKLQEVWPSSLTYCKLDRKMIWAACCLGFFGFLRAGEMTVRTYDASVQLSFTDIAVDGRRGIPVQHFRHTTHLLGCGHWISGIPVGGLQVTLDPVSRYMKFNVVRRSFHAGSFYLFFI